MQRVGADVLYSISTPTRLEIYNDAGQPIEHLDGIGECFLGLDAGSPVIARARFIDLPDAWSTFPNIDNLHFEVPEPATVFLLSLGGTTVLIRYAKGPRRAPLRVAQTRVLDSVAVMEGSDGRPS